MKDLKARYSEKQFLERFKAGTEKGVILSEQFGMYFLLTKDGDILFRLNALIDDPTRSPGEKGEK